MSEINSTLRTFFAIDLSEEHKEGIGNLIKELKKDVHGQSVRWVKPEHMHITLQFLADVDMFDVTAIIAEVTRELTEVTRFYLKLGALNAFPDMNHPKVIILDLLPVAELTVLSIKIGKGIERAGYPIEQRPFRGHLTLGRVEGGRRLALDHAIQLPSVEFIVDKVIYYRSEPHNQESRYTVLAEIPLKSSTPLFK